MAISRVKNWIAGEVLTASDLNTEFNNIIDNALSLISPLTGQLLMTAGSVTAPSIGVSGDTNTGIWSPAADEWAVSAGGRQQLTVKGANAGIQAGTYFVPIELGATETPRQNALFADSTVKAWCHFNAGGATTSIVSSYGIGTITDLGTGRTRFTFTRNFDSTYYIAIGISGNATVGGATFLGEDNSSQKQVGGWAGRTTDSTGAADDPATSYVAFIGLQAGG